MSSGFIAKEKERKSVVGNKLEKTGNGFYVNGKGKDRIVDDVDALFNEACMAGEWAIQKTDCLLSMFRYPAEYLEEVRQTRRARGSDGVHWGPFLWLDIDRENDLPAAVRDTVSLAKYIVYVLSDEKRDFTSENLQLWFSGCKGFHLGLPIEIFGDGVIPCNGFGKLCKAVAERLGKEAGVTIDNSVYDFVRMLRCPNTRHKTTWLYKIPVTLAELESENAVAMILQRAKQPRRLITNGTPVGDDVTYCPVTTCITSAVEMWNDAVAARSKSQYPSCTPTPYYGQPQIRRSTRDFLAGNVQQGNRAVELFKASADMCNNGFSEVNLKSQLTPAALKIGLLPQETARQINCGINAAKRSSTGIMSLAPQDLALAYLNSMPPFSRVYHATLWHIFHSEYGWIPVDKDYMEGDVRRFLRRHFEQWPSQKPCVSEYMVRDVMGCLKSMLMASLLDKNAMDTAVWLREKDGEIHTESAQGWIATQSYYIHVPMVAVALHRGTPIPANAILPADRSLFTLGAVPCEFDVHVQCPRWERFVQESCPGDAEMLQQMFGLSLTYDRRYNVFFTLWGEAGTGKSTALNVLAGLNTGTTCGVSLGKFSDRFATHALTKNRLNLVQDMESIFEGGGSVSKREGILKSCTAGEKEQVELKGEQLEYRHLCSLCVFGCNTLPRTADRSQAISDRTRIISFPNKFRGTNAQDLSLGQQLNNELPGILVWALKGYGALLDSGLPIFPETEHSKALKADNIKSSRPEELFCDEMLVKVDAKYILPTVEVYASYRAFCDQRGYKAVGENKVLPLIASYMGVEKDEGNTRTSTSYGRKKCFHGLRFEGQPPRTVHGEERFTP